MHGSPSGRHEYSLVDRAAERELLPRAQSLGLGAAPWSPLGGGLLTGTYRGGATGRISDLNRRVLRGHRAEDRDRRRRPRRRGRARRPGLPRRHRLDAGAGRAGGHGVRADHRPAQRRAARRLPGPAGCG
ncbi:aldo/keto reductase [Streptomyces sp. Tue6028]|uniref:aldo/keto reductase n=1 Tax=Streptomyces sp. Tue6028 TaxID=2036037 RepID=UPI00359CB304